MTFDREPGFSADRDERPLGERPGMNHDPLAPSFRDGPRATPATTRSLLLGLIPVVVIGAVVVVLISLGRA